MLLYLSEYSAHKKTTSAEITRVAHSVYQHYLALIAKKSAKNFVVVSHLQRQIALLHDPLHQKMLREYDYQIFDSDDDLEEDESF
jgi:hypothetical protein